MKRMLKYFESKKSKKRKQYFSFYDQLNEPERSRAKANYGTLNIQREPKVLTEALMFGFSWGESSEGGEYWKNIYYQLIDGKYKINKQ